MAETWLITGASRGMGLEFVRQCLADGHTVIAVARNPGSAGELADLARQHGERLRIEQADMASEAAIADLAARLAGTPIDVLLNNAGISIAGWPGAPVQPEPADLPYQAWEEVLRTNLFAPFALTVALRTNLAASARKLVVMMSSDLGSIAQNTMGGSYAYRASKAGLNMVTKGLSHDLKADGIAVVSMAPGWVRTELGTSAAMWSVEDSVANQRKVIAGLTAADTGKFVNLKGEPVPW